MGSMGAAGGGGRCTVKFARTLHQVRNPMHVLEDLISKHCVGGYEGIISDHYLTYASAFFPQQHPAHGKVLCNEATGTFLVG
jgi:hypothetical protein